MPYNVRNRFAPVGLRNGFRGGTATGEPPPSGGARRDPNMEAIIELLKGHQALLTDLSKRGRGQTGGRDVSSQGQTGGLDGQVPTGQIQDRMYDQAARPQAARPQAAPQPQMAQQAPRVAQQAPGQPQPRMPQGGPPGAPQGPQGGSPPTVNTAGLNRPTTLADVYQFYNTYLGRDPVFGQETQGWLGKPYNAVMQQVSQSPEANAVRNPPPPAPVAAVNQVSNFQQSERAENPPGRTTTLDDIYSMYNQYLGRDPVFGSETQGRVGQNYNSTMQDIMNSDEARGIQTPTPGGGAYIDPGSYPPPSPPINDYSYSEGGSPVDTPVNPWELPQDPGTGGPF